MRTINVRKLQIEREQLAKRLATLDTVLDAVASLDGKKPGRPRSTGSALGLPQKKKSMPASARKRIAAAQRARWQKWREAKAQKKS